MRAGFFTPDNGTRDFVKISGFFWFTRRGYGSHVSARGCELGFCAQRYPNLIPGTCQALDETGSTRDESLTRIANGEHARRRDRSQ